jgi:hypothetical protein
MGRALDILWIIEQTTNGNSTGGTAGSSGTGGSNGGTETGNGSMNGSGSTNGSTDGVASDKNGKKNGKKHRKKEDEDTVRGFGPRTRFSYAAFHKCNCKNPQSEYCKKYCGKYT